MTRLLVVATCLALLGPSLSGEARKSDPLEENRAHVVQALELDSFIPRTDAQVQRMPTRAEVEAILPGLEIVVFKDEGSEA